MIISASVATTVALANKLDEILSNFVRMASVSIIEAL